HQRPATSEIRRRIRQAVGSSLRVVSRRIDLRLLRRKANGQRIDQALIERRELVFRFPRDVWAHRPRATSAADDDATRHRRSDEILIVESRETRMEDPRARKER